MKLINFPFCHFTSFFERQWKICDMNLSVIWMCFLEDMYRNMQAELNQSKNLGTRVYVLFCTNTADEESLTPRSKVCEPDLFDSSSALWGPLLVSGPNTAARFAFALAWLCGHIYMRNFYIPPHFFLSSEWMRVQII